MGIEGTLMRSDGGFRCADCYYFDVREGAPYCKRRERAIRWNPVLFFCTEYGSTASGDNEVPFATNLDLWS